MDREPVPANVYAQRSKRQNLIIVSSKLPGLRAVWLDSSIRRTLSFEQERREAEIRAAGLHRLRGETVMLERLTILRRHGLCWFRLRTSSILIRLPEFIAGENWQKKQLLAKDEIIAMIKVRNDPAILPRLPRRL